MIRQSKTTIKELSAQYRSVLKRAFFAGLVALTTSVANADTDVTFAGNYTNTSGDTVNVNDPVANIGYEYTNSNGDTVNVASQSTDPTLSDFTYTNAEGNPADLSTGTDLTAGDFSGASAADGITTVISNQTIAALEEISRDNYSYVNGAGETVTLGETAGTFTETVALDATYASVASVDVTDGADAPVLTGDMYSYTDPDTGAVYHVNASGDGVVDANNIVVTPDAGTALETACNEMIAAFISDSNAITAAKTTVDGYAAAEVTAFADADGVYNTDAGTISTLTTNYGTYTDALGLLSDAQAAQSAAQSSYDANDADRIAALDVYDAPITTTITDGANDAIDASITDGSIRTALDDTEQNAKDYADSLADNYDAAGAADAAEQNAKDYADGLADNYDAAGAANAAEQNANTYTDGKVDAEMARARDEESAIRDEFAAADADLQDAIDNEAARAQAAESALRNEFASANAETLAKANAYTDKKVDTLEKNVSGGIAAATALSAVAVSNVAKGEVSVGGGYGYYNDQSAVALGATMGLSDRWSVNAGAGLATGDKTQFAIRAGTNYKFKLF